MATLEITTKIGCTLACKFCPQNRLSKNYGSEKPKFLELEDFKRAIDKIPSYVRIDFSGMCEPWLNPKATDMVDYAYSKNHEVAVFTTLQGLSRNDLVTLWEKHGHRVSLNSPWVIHLPDDSNNMPGWKVSPEYKETLAELLKIKQANPQTCIHFMTMSPAGTVHHDLGDIFGDTLYRFMAISRAGNLSKEKLPENEVEDDVAIDGAVLCNSTPYFDRNGMLPNGDVVLCCMDYSLEWVLGNLFHQSYEELFTGPVMAKLRLKAMQPYFDPDLICKKCSNAVPVNLPKKGDNHWETAKACNWCYQDKPKTIVTKEFLVNDSIPQNLRHLLKLVVNRVTR